MSYLPHVLFTTHSTYHTFSLPHIAFTTHILFTTYPIYHISYLPHILGTTHSIYHTLHLPHILFTTHSIYHISYLLYILFTTYPIYHTSYLPHILFTTCVPRWLPHSKSFMCVCVWEREREKETSSPTLYAQPTNTRPLMPPSILRATHVLWHPTPFSRHLTNSMSHVTTHTTLYAQPAYTRPLMTPYILRATHVLWHPTSLKRHHAPYLLSLPTPTLSWHSTHCVQLMYYDTLHISNDRYHPISSASLHRSVMTPYILHETHVLWHPAPFSRQGLGFRV